MSYTTRAKYYRQSDGSLRLASIQHFNAPKFVPSGYERRESEHVVADEIDRLEDGCQTADESPSIGNIERATRRARKNAFDLIMCNPDLDAFATFTYSPDEVDNKADYDECYRYLGRWLDNRVQRRGLKYVCVPERTKRGDIHFHAICNKEALKIEQAFSPHTGRALTHHGKPIYNLTDWTRGFSTVEEITRLGDGEDERAMVSKYIFKYMGKQAGQKIGGRYVLIGGDLAKPVYLYGDAPEEFFNGSHATYVNEVHVDDLTYREWSYI